MMHREFDQARDRAIRKRIIGIYNKRLDDFTSLKEYNDYLEQVEDIIYNLVNDMNVEETNEKVAKYKEENENNIRMNRIKLNREQEERIRKVNLLKQQQQQQEVDGELNGDGTMMMMTDDALGTNAAAIAQQQQQQQQGFLFNYRQPRTLSSVKSAASMTNDATSRALRMKASGYNQNYPLLRARIEADQTVF